MLWFEIHNEAQILVAKSLRSDKRNVLSLLLQDIITVEEEYISKTDVFQWKFGFRVITKERGLVLFAKTEEDKYMWLFTLYSIPHLQSQNPFKIRESVFYAALYAFDKPALDTLKLNQFKATTEVLKKKKASKRLTMYNGEDEKAVEDFEQADKFDNYYKENKQVKTTLGNNSDVSITEDNEKSPRNNKRTMSFTKKNEEMPFIEEEKHLSNKVIKYHEEELKIDKDIKIKVEVEPEVDENKEKTPDVNPLIELEEEDLAS